MDIYLSLYGHKKSRGVSESYPSLFDTILPMGGSNLAISRSCHFAKVSASIKPLSSIFLTMLMDTWYLNSRSNCWLSTLLTPVPSCDVAWMRAVFPTTTGIIKELLSTLLAA